LPHGECRPPEPFATFSERWEAPRMKAPIVGLLLIAALLGVARGEEQGQGRDREFFEKHVRPLLARQCYECHSGQARRLEANLRLDSRGGVLAGGDMGPAIVPGKPEESLLIEAVRYDDVALQMPPHGKLPAEDIAMLTSWVSRGAPWPDEAAVSGEAPSGRANRPDFDLAARKREHWAWQPVKRQPPPAVGKRAWPKNEIDPFVLEKLESRGIEPAGPADPRTLIRRLSFDLIGLPPTPAEVAEFVADPSPAGYRHAVDRLLASPRFGERWARHWLDLVRYGESRGHEYDYDNSNAFEYRDYVVRALNADVPYDQFVREHLAGDLLEHPRLHPTLGFNESALGTGFWFLGEWVHSPVDPRRDEADRFDNAVDVLGKTFLGLTVACARCHDHKFDAISTKDYYALFGFLRSSHYHLAPFDVQEPNRAVAAELAQQQPAHRAAIERALAAAYAPGLARMSDYLLAARSALAAGISDRQLATLAAAEKLNAQRLGGWVQCLLKAAADPLDPLYAWARLSLDKSTAGDGAADVLGKKLAAQLATLENKARHALDHADVVVDFAACGPEDWRQDGFTFGQHAARPGDWQLSDDPSRPLLRITEHSAAERSRLWPAMTLAAGVQNEPGRMAEWVRAGQTLYTRTFNLSHARLFYLVRGGCHVYAEVDSHRTNAGPLHGQLIGTFDQADGSYFRWVSQDLRAYRGHRVHLEFTPTHADFALAMVVQADEKPGDPFARPVRPIAVLVQEPRTPEALAAGYQQVFQQALVAWPRRNSADQSSAGQASSAGGQLTAWIADHDELLAGDAAASQRVAQAVARWKAVRDPLRAGVKSSAHLAPALMDGSGDDQPVLVRGNPNTPGPLVPRRFLEAIAGDHQPPITRGSGRLELAERMLAADDPFITRVIVNRLWHHLFGRGIVASVDNFGVLGQPPSHPELLDYLATRLVDEGWSLKKMIRLIVSSQTYQMASAAADARAEQLDPKNLLLHRMSVRRLEAEAVRDSILALSGSLAVDVGGRSVPVHLTAFMGGRGRPSASGPLDGDGRRSLYIAVRRNFLPPLLSVFDMPAPVSTVGARNVSNVPAQALALMNDPLVVSEARKWAERLCRQPESRRQRIERMYQAAFARPATDAEQSAAQAFLDEQAADLGPGAAVKDDEARLWADLGHCLFNAKEFVFIH
jgi:hypothetical protein